MAKFYRNDLSGSQKIDITIGTFKTEDDQIEKKDEYIFSFTATLETQKLNIIFWAEQFMVNCQIWKKMMNS